MKQIKKIAITNEKGGVGKTMTAVNLSACLAQRGYRVLLIDADPQGYATLNYDVDVSPSLLEVLRGQVACTKAVQTTRFGVDVLPSDRTLSVIEEDLIRQKMNGAPYLNTLEKALEDLPDYDFVIIDCPPQGGRLMDIVHYYADAIIMPMFAEDYGIHALTLKAEAIADIRRTINPNLKILGGLITMDERRGLRSVFREVLLGQDLLPMFSTTIRRNVALIRAVNLIDADRIDMPGEVSYHAVENSKLSKPDVMELLQYPIGVTLETGGRYRVFLGAYRFWYLRECLHWTKIPCYVYKIKRQIRDPRERRRREIHRRQQAAESPRIRLQLYENYYKLLKGMKDAGEIKGGLQTRLMQLLGVSERTVRIYKQLSEQLTGREKQRLMRGKLPFVQARAIAAERNQKAAMLPDFEKAEKTKDKNLPAGSGE